MVGRGVGIALAAVVALAGAGGARAQISEADLQANICTADELAAPNSGQLLLAGLQALSSSSTGNRTAACPPPPIDYQSPPEVTAAGDVNVRLALGAGLGVGTDNQNLCFAGRNLPAAPVIRIKRGNRLTIRLTNTLLNTGPDKTKNCPIEGYLNGAPVPRQCSQPEQQFKAAPGANGRYYRIETSIPHLADGSSNLHTHGLEVSPKPCHDEVLRSTLYAANWGGPTAPLLGCQDAPNQLTYTYDIPNDHPVGLAWYHTHRHGQAQAQTMMGATGGIIIEDEDDDRRRARGVTDDVLIIRDLPSSYATGLLGGVQSHKRTLNALYAHPRAPTVPNHPAINPRIDRDHEVVCATGDSDAGGPAITSLTLNGALVTETETFPPPDAQVLSKTMAPGERQIWRILNASAQTYVSPQLVLAKDGKERVLPLKIVARDGVPVHDDDGKRRFQVLDTQRQPLLLATANRVEILVHAPPPGATLYLDSIQVLPGCAGDGAPARRLLRVTSSGEAAADAPETGDEDIEPRGRETKYTQILSRAPDVRRVFAFTEYPRSFTVDKSRWLIGPPADGQYDPLATDFYLTMTRSSDGQAAPVRIEPFTGKNLKPDVVVHLRGRESVIEEWVIENYTLEIHAFHIHQIHFRDMTPADAIDGDPPILDTVNVRAAARGASTEPGVDVPTKPGTVRLLMKFTRAAIGEFVFHCHILEHEDNGMMQKIRVVAD